LDIFQSLFGVRIINALRYASQEDNELWSTLPEAEAQAPDYTQFRDAVIKLYPGADDERKYAESDLERLINMQRQYGIESRAELGHYYREFCHISKFLIDKRRLSDIELNKMYMRGFDERLRERMKGRLQVKFPDHYHDDPYEWQDFHDCAHFLLAGMAAESSVGTVTQARVPVVFTVPPAFSTPPPVATVVKTEDPASILQDSLWRMETMFAGVIYQNTHGGAPAAYALVQQYATLPQQYATLPHQYAAPPRQYAAPPRQYATLPLQQYSAPPLQSYTTSAVPTSAGPRPKQKCHFDSCPRMIRDCPGAADYIGRSLCKRDPASNRIVLLNNAWIPRWTASRRGLMIITDRIPYPPPFPPPSRSPPPPVSKTSHRT
jgi:hypothetical protein